MFKLNFAGGLSALLLMAGITMGYGNEAAASSQTNLGNERIFNAPVVRQQVQVKTYPTVNVGYIVVGDTSMILDDATMGYIRRMLNVKFPGEFYPPKRITDVNGSYRKGRRNYTDKYKLEEARDVLTKEFERLEEKAFQQEEQEKQPVAIQNITLGKEKDVHMEDRPNVLNEIEHFGTNHAKEESTEDTGKDNRYMLTRYLSRLPKADYVSFARQACAEGKSDYDYLIIFNIHCFNADFKKIFMGSILQEDISISVKAIDIASGEYIDRNEYLKRGYSGSASWTSPSWRRSMRRAIVDGMIECFDNLPIGKYSVCDNPYCERRQREIQEEAVLGRDRRHCVKHCHTMEKCDDHIVNYAIDADLPPEYIGHDHNKVD